MSHEQMEEDQKKYFEMFSNLKEPEDFFKKLTPSAKSRFVKNFQTNNEDSNFLGNNHEQISKNIYSDYFSNNLALKNYNISPSNISSLNTSFTKVIIDETNKNSKINAKSLFFNDNDMNNPENVAAASKNSKSPIYYVGTPPPGLTPKKNAKDTPKSLQKLNEELKQNENIDGFKNFEGYSNPEKKVFSSILSNLYINEISKDPENSQNINQKTLNFQPLTINIDNDFTKNHSNFSHIKPQQV